MSTYDIDTDEDAEQSLADTPANGVNGQHPPPEEINGSIGANR